MRKNVRIAFTLYRFYSSAPLLSSSETAHTSDCAGPNPTLGARKEQSEVARRSVEPWEIWPMPYQALAGYLYTAFASQADYEYVLNYAKAIGIVLWESSSRRCFFGSIEGHPNIRGFIERRSASNA